MKTVGKDPCGREEDILRCPHWQRCKDRKLACEMFRSYVRGFNPDHVRRMSAKERRTPYKAIYLQIFKENDEDDGTDGHF